METRSKRHSATHHRPPYPQTLPQSHHSSAASSLFQSSSSLSSLASLSSLDACAMSPQPRSPTDRQQRPHQPQHTSHQPQQQYQQQYQPQPNTNPFASSAPMPSPSARQQSHYFATAMPAQNTTSGAAGGATSGAGAPSYMGQRAGSGGGPPETAPFLRDFTLLAEAAKRAQMACLVRDLDDVGL